MSGAKDSAPTSEKTFRTYTDKQGATYAQARDAYHANLFKRIVDHHLSTGGQLGTLVDVGCGPGTAIRPLAPHFEVAIGLDPSEGMITAAKELGGVSADGQPIRFECSSAEEMGADTGLILNGTADLIIAATAAHWFDMSRFWPRAAQLLRPGGTVALWTGQYMGAHPSMPNAEAITAATNAIEKRELEPYMEPGNLLTRSLYVGMPLPWELTPDPVSAFDEKSFFRKEWGTPGQDDGEEEGHEFFAVRPMDITLDILELAIGTASPVTRWRQANPDKVGTEQDVAKKMRRETERLLREAGVPEGKEVLKGRLSAVLMVVKKKA